MSDVKNLVKEARKHIDEKNFKEAQECCKTILRKDKKNYFALVLLGKSFQDSDQAVLAYQKAISIKPDQTLAWQGLANYYDQKDDISIKIKLFDIYSNILNLQIEDDKALEIITKLGNLGISLKSSEALSALSKYLSQEHDPKLTEAAKTQFIEILKADTICIQDDIPLTLNVMQKIITETPSDSLEVLYGKIILQKSNFSSAVEEIINLKSFSTNVSLREWLSYVLCQKYVEDESFSGFPIENHVDNIIAGIEKSKYPGLLKSIISYNTGDVVEAYKQCVPLINYHESDIVGATFIIKCAFKLNKWSVAQKLATNFLTKAKDRKFANKLNQFLFLSLAKQQKWQQAISVGKNIPILNLDDYEKASLAECYIEVNESVDHIMSSLKDTEYHIQLQALLLLKQEKYNEVVSLLESSKENSLHLFYLGKAYWNLKEHDKCLVTLLKAAKLNSEHADTFLYLGHFYHYHKPDIEKAKKCYEKAYSINNDNVAIAKNLSEIYSKSSSKDCNFELLNNAQKNVQTGEHWVDYRLGLHYLHERDMDNAIIKFKKVIKSDLNNATAFECLADAYYSRGSYTSALTAYQKVMTLNSDRAIHCLTRTGYIYTLFTKYDDAITTFERVLQMDPYSLLALKGIAETWLKIAKKKESAKLYGCARDCAQFAVNYISKALMRQKKFLSLWKLLADVLMLITRLPKTYANVCIQNTFDDPTKEAVKLEKLDIQLKAIAFYSYVAKRKHQMATLDLAFSYLSHYLETKKDTDGNITYNLAIQCIKVRPSSWCRWNLLGRICMLVKKYDIAQHCFIKALLLTRKWSVAKLWCNLGTLYVKLKLYKLANYCFWRGQSTSPSYPLSWTGQALIAEAIREEEAMDLFRHACRLGYHPVSAIGYADWVCRTLQIANYKQDPECIYVIEGLYAIPHAMDLLGWYTIYEPNNDWAWTVLGILQERNGMQRAALKSYEKASEHAKEDKKNLTLLNVARMYLRLGKFDEAIEAYQAITEASLNSACGLALALFKKGLYEESYSAYDTALHWLSNDDNEKADLLVAMACIVYKFKGADDAKTVLFHSIQVSQKKPTAYSLFSICSLGIIHSDQSLSKLALSELQKYETDSDFGFDIGFLKAYLLVSEGTIEKAVKVLSESLHDHPYSAELWLCMAHYCLRTSKPRARLASSCAQRAMYAARHSDCDINPAQIIAIRSVAEYMAGNKRKALDLAKRGLHIYPSQAEIWAALLFSLHSQVDKKHWLVGAAGFMRRRLDISRPLSRWAGTLEKKLLK